MMKVIFRRLMIFQKRKPGEKKLTFAHKYLREGIDKEAFIEMLNLLPSDTKICGFYEEPGMAATSLLISSYSFREIHPTHCLPEAIATFEQDQLGKIHCTKIEEAE